MAVDPEANTPAVEFCTIDHASVRGADLIFQGCQRVVGQFLKEGDDFASGTRWQTPERFGEIDVEDDLARRHLLPLRFELLVLFFEVI